MRGIDPGALGRGSAALVLAWATACGSSNNVQFGGPDLGFAFPDAGSPSPDAGADAGLTDATSGDAAPALDGSGAPDVGGVGLTDDMSGAIVQASDRFALEEGSAASTRATDLAVKILAQEEVADHTVSEQTLVAVLWRLGLTVGTSTLAQAISRAGAIDFADLDGRSGAAFDREYLGDCVTGHARLLELLDTTLIPAAMNPDWVAFLHTYRVVISTHLKQAQEISAALP
jgi:putative membrane protein